MVEDEWSKQKPEGSKQKPEGSKNRLISSVPYENLRVWQTYILALIIILAYIVFFGYIMVTSPDVTGQTGKKVMDYSGMTTLTGTFGIIAAAVVGYYFGQRNLKQAADIAEHATEIAKEAKDDADGKKTQLKKEKKDRVLSLKTAVPIYKDAQKFINVATKIISPADMNSISKEVNVDSLTTKINERLTDVQTTLHSKEHEVDDIESSTPEE